MCMQGRGSVAKSRRPQIQMFTESSVLCAFHSMTNHYYLPPIFLNPLAEGAQTRGGGTFEFSLHTSLKSLLVSGCSEAIWRSF